MHLQYVQICTPWLHADDYPVMLRSADLGISLHTSTCGLLFHSVFKMHFYFTGVDLPMKIVDMFGCGLPVLSVHFPAINELVVEKQNGYTFTTSQRLAALMIQVLSGFPDECKVCV
jgi:beta-1,4-mannosyltransferase